MRLKFVQKIIIMGYYNNLYKYNSSNNSFGKASLKSLFREIQSTYIDNQYISNLCADTSVNYVLITLLLTALDSLKNINSKINHMEKKLRLADPAQLK